MSYKPTLIEPVRLIFRHCNLFIYAFTHSGPDRGDRLFVNVIFEPNEDGPSVRVVYMGEEVEVTRSLEAWSDDLVNIYEKHKDDDEICNEQYLDMKAIDGHIQQLIKEHNNRK